MGCTGYVGAYRCTKYPYLMSCIVGGEMDNINLVLKHYNKIKPINCTVLSGDIRKIFTVKFNENENNGTGMIKGDPVLIGVLDRDNALQVHGGSVVSGTPQEDEYILCSNEVVKMSNDQEKRQFERYPSSLLGDIKLLNSSKREASCIKDISYSGMGVYSEGDFNIDDIVEVTIYLSNNVTRFDGTIMRKELTFGRHEYGIQIIHRDKTTMEASKSQIYNLLQSEKELMLRHILSANLKI